MKYGVPSLVKRENALRIGIENILDSKSKYDGFDWRQVLSDIIRSTVSINTLEYEEACEGHPYEFGHMLCSDVYDEVTKYQKDGGKLLGRGNKAIAKLYLSPVLKKIDETIRSRLEGLSESKTLPDLVEEYVRFYGSNADDIKSRILSEAISSGVEEHSARVFAGKIVSVAKSVIQEALAYREFAVVEYDLPRGFEIKHELHKNGGGGPSRWYLGNYYGEPVMVRSSIGGSSWSYLKKKKTHAAVEYLLGKLKENKDALDPDFYALLVEFVGAHG